MNNQPEITDSMSLAEARAIMEQTGICPSCATKAQAYQYSLNKTGVNSLRKIYLRVVTTEVNLVNVNDVGLTYLEHTVTSKLRYHGLIAKAKDEDGNHLRNTWLITRRGAAFLRNKESIPRKVKVYKNQVVDHSTDMMSVVDVLGQDPKVPAARPFEYVVPTAADAGKAVQRALF